MLLLLLGIIVLHVTVLVLLFVSTIVSVSTDFLWHQSTGKAGSGWWGHAMARKCYLHLWVVLPLAFSRKPLLAHCWSNSEILEHLCCQMCATVGAQGTYVSTEQSALEAHLLIIPTQEQL